MVIGLSALVLTPTTLGNGSDMLTMVAVFAWFCCKDRALVAGDPREDEMTSQAATWNSPAMNSAWALMSLPLMFRICPFLIIAIAS